MNRRTRTVRSVLASIATAALVVTAAAVGVPAAPAAAAAAADTLVYNSIPTVSPPAYPSLGYQATSTSEFGDFVRLAGTDRALSGISIGLTNWACENWASAPDPCASTPGSSFSHPITVNIYDVVFSGGVPAAGDRIATITESKQIPYRPSASPQCTGNRWYDNATARCSNGYSFTLDFDFSAQGVVLDDNVIVSVAYNTQSYGVSPLGVSGPYNSLNVSLADDVPAVGTDENADEMFWKTTYPGYTGQFIVDSGWGGFNGLVLAIATDPDLPPAPAEVTVYQRDVKPTENPGTYQFWHEGRNNPTPAYQVKTDGLHFGVGAASTIIKGTDVENSALTESQLRALLIGGASVDVVSGSTTFQVPVFFGPTANLFTTLRSTSLGAGLKTFSLTDNWATTRAFGPYSAQQVAPLGELLNAVYNSGGPVYLAGFGVQADFPAVVSSVTWSGTRYQFFQPEIVQCTPTAGSTVTNLDSTGWDFSQTRSQGSNVFVDGGLRVTTSGQPTPNPDQRKAAGYRAINIALADVGTPSIMISNGFTGVRPSLQLGLDADGNGTQDAYLVGEPWAYGGGAWSPTVNGSWDDAKFWSNADFGVGAGAGYPSLGTLAQYLLANPMARILSYGYSLGSGVNGDAVIESISVGCSTTLFDFELGTLTTSTPTVSGTPTVGQTLAADAGMWGPAPVALSYQWLADGLPISGATDAAFVLSANELGAVMRVSVTGSRAGYVSATRTSNSTNPVAPASTGFAVLSGVGSAHSEDLFAGLATVDPAIDSYSSRGSALVTTRAGGTPFPRPTDSIAGQLALSLSASGGSLSGVPIAGQVDFARSAVGPSSSLPGNELTFIPFARDALTFGVSVASDIPRDIALGNASHDSRAVPIFTLRNIYRGVVTSFMDSVGNTVTIRPLLPPVGSETRQWWLDAVALTEAQLGANVVTVASTEFNGASVVTPSDIVPFSVSNFIAQGNHGQLPAPLAETRSILELGHIDTVKAMVRDANDVLTVNPDATISRPVFIVVETARLTGTSASDVALQTLFQGATSTLCSNGAVVKQYGFATIGADCGNTTLYRQALRLG